MAGDDPTAEVLDWLSRIEALNREWFMRTEEILHKASHGPTWLANEAVANKLAENLHRLDGTAFRLDAFSIMSNHAHTVLKPFLSASDLLHEPSAIERELGSQSPGLAKIMHSLKGRSARECNLLLGRSGSFWEHESFDHVIRKGKFDKTISYVLNNPVKVSLVNDWADWPWNYCREELAQRFRKN